MVLYCRQGRNSGGLGQRPKPVESGFGFLMVRITKQDLPPDAGIGIVGAKIG
jgi:hypothetical protein